MRAHRNANDSISVFQVAEGSMNEQSSILTRMRELLMRSASDTIGDNERDMVESEYREMADELQRIAESTSCNGEQLLTNTDKNFDFKDFQIGIHDEAESRLTIEPLEISTDEETLGIPITSAWSKEDTQMSLSHPIVCLGRLRKIFQKILWGFEKETPCLFTIVGLRCVSFQDL
jgi:flagellin